MTLALLRQLRISIQQREERLLYRSPLFVLILSVVYVSQMQALGVDIQTIQSIVGHADTEMTEHYLHVQESIRQSAIQLFSEAFSA